MSELRFLQKSGASDIELATMCKKLSATANRCEGVYNRAGERSETFCGKEEQRHEQAI